MRRVGGGRLESLHELREYVLENLDRFGADPSEKLMTCATGHPPDYAERHEIHRIVRENPSRPGESAGFRGLLPELIRSVAFRTR